MPLTFIKNLFLQKKDENPAMFRKILTGCYLLRLMEVL